MEKIVPVDEGAEAFVELLNANGVEYIFLNPGTDTFPVQEALSKFRALGKRAPKVVLCLDESVAMAAAHGYFAVTGKPQVVFLHVDLGTLQVGGALHNAQRGRIGVVFCAGRAPSTIDGNVRGERSAGIHWIQEQYDQGGIVRNYVKWEYELRSNAAIHQVMQRAFQVAGSEPTGPVYLTLPRELLMEKIKSVTIPDVTKHAPVVTPQADPAALSEVSEALLQAQSPLIVAGDVGRHPGAVASLVALAETLGARVMTDAVRMSFPNNHPLASSGFGGVGAFKDADVILLIDKDIPYIPRTTKPGADARIFHISIDPIKNDIPLWVFPGDLFIQAESSKAIPALNEIIKKKITAEQKNRFKARARQIAEENEQVKKRQHDMAMSKASQKPISPQWVGHCLSEIMEEDMILVHEMAGAAEIARTKPGTVFGSGGSSLGFGLGGALGVKLASPDKTVVSLMGDGCFVFGCPIATLWAASVYKAPFLSVIFNNQQYHAPKGGLGIRGAYGKDSYSEKTGVWEGIDILPSPDYALVAKACGGWGQKVEDPAELAMALKKGLDQVSNGVPAVIDVRLESPNP
ncbi:MAG: thiamine pyrophosphate-requiring protein [Chloroflexi bacterium]|nr:thiamine pyrophosphate-requiring protein [Chloroflexota bacterium]